MNRSLLVSALLYLMATESAPVLAEEPNVVFGCNYTVFVSIDGQEYSVSHQDRVRSGSAIPLNLQEFLLQLRITELESETATVELVLSEKTENGWHKIYATPPSFTINLGVPTEIKHSDDIATFDIALIASKLLH